MRLAWVVIVAGACAGRGGGKYPDPPPRAPQPAEVVTVACVEGGDAQATEEEIARLGAQLRKTDPSIGDVVAVRRVVREDLDGDGRPDAAFAVNAGDLDALLVQTSSFPTLRILQFADGEPLDLLGTVDLDPKTRGRQLVVRSTQAKGVSLEVVRDTGEVVARARCAP